MSMFIDNTSGWKRGYGTIGILQFILVTVLIFTLPLWRKFERKEEVFLEDEKHDVSIQSLLRLKGAKSALISFFAYCAVEATASLWGSSFLVICKGISVERAAKWVSLYYLGITVGRFLAKLYK